MNTRSIRSAGLRPAPGASNSVATFRLTCVLLSACFASALFAADPAPAKSRIELLNGRDLAGWRVFTADKNAEPSSVATVADGVLKISGKPNGYVATLNSYTNYQLHVEWRWPADAPNNANSGLLLHVNGPDMLWPHCIEAQLRTGGAGMLIGLGGGQFAAEGTGRPRANRIGGSVEKKHGEWNSYDIVCRGDTIEVFVNDVRQNFIEKVAAPAGLIALQSEGTPIEFRNVWLEKL